MSQVETVAMVGVDDDGTEDSVDELSGGSDGRQSGFSDGGVAAEVRPLVARYLATLDERLPGRAIAAALVGSAALGGFRPGHSGLDLVVITEIPLAPDEIRLASAANSALRYRGQDAVVCYSTWAGLRDGGDGGVCFLGRRRLAGAGLATPLTTAIVAGGAPFLRGERPADLILDPAALEAWAAGRLRATGVSRGHGLLVARRRVAPLVLEVAQLAQIALTGQPWSKDDAAEALRAKVSSRYGRVLADALGYRQGAHTSMYWGPIERRGDAVGLIVELQRLVG